MLLKCIMAGNGNEISSKILSDMKELPLGAVICPEAVTFTDKIISLSTSSSDKIVQDIRNEMIASKLTPVENSLTVIMDALCSSQEDNVTVLPETPSSSQQQEAGQQQQPLPQQEDSIQQVSAESASQPGSLETMTLETLNIPSHVNNQMLHHCVSLLISLLFRFPVYFKPLYRLAWLFYKLKAFQVNSKSINHLLFVTAHPSCSLQKCVC